MLTGRWSRIGCAGAPCAWLVLLIGLAVGAMPPLAGAQPSAASGGAAETPAARLSRELGLELARVRAYLRHVDQLNRLEVAQGRLGPADADARLRARAQELAERGFTDDEYRRLLDLHRDAVRAYLAGVERDVAQAARWPGDRPPQAYQARARLRLAALRADHDARVAARLDALPVLRGASLVQAWTRGEGTLAPERDPFAAAPEGLLAVTTAPALRDAATAAERFVQAAAKGAKAPPEPRVALAPAASSPAAAPASAPGARSLPSPGGPPSAAVMPPAPPAPGVSPAAPPPAVAPVRPPAPSAPPSSVSVAPPPAVAGPVGPGWPPSPPIPVTPGQPGPPPSAAGPRAASPPSVGLAVPPGPPGVAPPSATLPNITLRLPPGGAGLPEMEVPWALPATPFRPLQGMRLAVVCPPGGQPGPLFGTDVYADDSSICTAAAHAGLVTLAAGGRVLIELGPERSAFAGSARHGLVSGSRGAWPASFRVLGAASAVPPSSPGPPAVAPGPGGRVAPAPGGADARIEHEIASVGGKYRGLVAVVRGRLPEPHGTDGTADDDGEEEEPDVIEMGYRRAGTWQGHGSVPAGFWVYAHPHLYVWRELTPR